MNATNASPKPPSADPSTRVTHVDLTFIENRIEQWIAFGHLKDGERIDKHRSIASFAAGNVFAVTRWAVTTNAKMLARIDILRAADIGDPFDLVPLVRPGAQVLLTVQGAVEVDYVLRTIQGVRNLGIDPADVAPDYWAHVANRLAANQEPRSYSRMRHAAWLLRKRLTS